MPSFRGGISTFLLYMKPERNPQVFPNNHQLTEKMAFPSFLLLFSEPGWGRIIVINYAWECEVQELPLGLVFPCPSSRLALCCKGTWLWLSETP